MKRRLFVALSIPRELKRALSKWMKEAAQLNIFEAQEIRWTRSDNLHLTVCFLGTVAEKSLPSVKTVLRRVAQDTASFSLSLAGLILAPQPRPRMIWAVFAESSEFAALVTKVAKGLLLLPARPVIPHVTLARFRGVRRAVKLPKPPPAEAFKVASLELFESKTLPHGAVYNKLGAYPLVGN